jgi:hypothetical protein
MRTFVSIILVLAFWVTLHWFRPAFEQPDSGWAAAIGSAFALSSFTFIGATIGCRFFIDRKKVAEAEFWPPLVGDFYPPKKYLKPGGHPFANTRYYSGISTLILMVGVLICAP